ALLSHDGFEPIQARGREQFPAPLLGLLGCPDPARGWSCAPGRPTISGDEVAGSVQGHRALAGVATGRGLGATTGTGATGPSRSRDWCPGLAADHLLRGARLGAEELALEVLRDRARPLAGAWLYLSPVVGPAPCSGRHAAVDAAAALSVLRSGGLLGVWCGGVRCTGTSTVHPGVRSAGVGSARRADAMQPAARRTVAEVLRVRGR